MQTLLIYLITGIFGLAILGKFTGKTKATFEKAGYSYYFMYGLAISELVMTGGLFTDYALFAVIGLLFIMIGAVLTLFRQKAKPQQYILSTVAISLLLALYGCSIYQQFK